MIHFKIKFPLSMKNEMKHRVRNMQMVVGVGFEPTNAEAGGFTVRITTTIYGVYERKVLIFSVSVSSEAALAKPQSGNKMVTF